MYNLSVAQYSSGDTQSAISSIQKCIDHRNKNRDGLASVSDEENIHIHY